MLDLESRQDILGITVFRDADNAEQFYHLPGPPKISRDSGGPMFDLMTYRKGGAAGQTVASGFLTMTVDVGLGELELSYVDPGGDPDFAQHEELLFDDTAATQGQDWKVRLKDRNARSYSYRVRGVPPAGSEIAGPVTSSESDLLLIRPPVAG
jgi:hypothetical protein